MSARSPRSLPARRILIYGVTGSGKSTLAESVAARTGLPWFSVDDLMWEPGWIAVAQAEQRARIAAICARDEWILDTAYSGWRELVLDRAELVVGLDYPRWRSLGRLVRRTAGRIRDRRPICNGNVETLRGAFSRDSIIAWHFRSFRRKRAHLREWAARDGRRVLLFRSPTQTDHWLATLAGPPAGG